MPPEILDGCELAAKLGRPYEDVMSWARAGDIPSFKVSGRRFFSLPAVVETIRRRQASRREAIPA